MDIEKVLLTHLPTTMRRVTKRQVLAAFAAVLERPMDYRNIVPLIRSGKLPRPVQLSAQGLYFDTEAVRGYLIALHQEMEGAARVTA
jgi:hypothetical protein